MLITPFYAFIGFLPFTSLPGIAESIRSTLQLIVSELFSV